MWQYGCAVRRWLIGLGLLVSLSACGSEIYPVNTYVWDVSKGSTLEVYFPERDAPLPPATPLTRQAPDFRTDAFKAGVEAKKTFGLAFAGGGTRAATMALGQLRALHELGWIKKVHYISAVSGGAWAVVPYSFLPGDDPIEDPDCRAWRRQGAKSFTDEQFLGRYRPPNTLKWDQIDTEPPEGSLAKAISESWLVIRTVWHLLTNLNDEAYATAVGDTFLKPFGLSSEIGLFDAESQSFALRPESVKHSGRDVRHFHFLRCGRPYPIINATVVTKGLSHRQEHLFRLEITPDYAGVRTRFNIPGEPHDDPRRFGGQYIQTVTYDFHQRTKTEGEKPFSRWQIKTGGRTGSFSLSDVAGVSGAAPQDILSKIGFGNLGFPEYHLWPHDTESGLTVPKRDFYHGDGGHLENLGLMALLARRVQNIITFVNTVKPFKCRTDQCQPGSGQKVTEKVLAKYVISFFRQLKKNNGSPRKYSFNLVFEDGENKLEELVGQFEKKKSAGRPLIFCGQYDVRANVHFGIRDTENYRPNICWIYLDRTADWLKALTDEKLKKYAKRKWRNLPHFKTFFPGLFKPSAVDLANAEVNLGSNLAAWTVCQSATILREELPNLDLKVRPRSESDCHP